MTTSFFGATFALSLACTIALAGHVLAADKVSKDVGKPLMDAQKAMQSGDLQGALADVKQAQAVSDRTPYDDYNINKFLGYISIKLNDHATADTAFEAMAESPAMPDEEKKDTLHNAILLSAEAKHYQKTIAYSAQLAALNGMDDVTTADLAIAYYESGDTAHAQQYAQQGINMAKSAGKQPNPGLLQIVMNAQVKSNNQAGAEQTLEQLVLSSGDLGALGQLIDVSLSAPGMNSMYFLDLYRLKLLAGAMQAEDYVQLANQAYLQGYPAEAVNVAQQGISSGKIGSGRVSETLRKSRNDAATDERQLPGIAAAAAKAKSGEQDVKLAEDYWGYGRYADTEAAARRAIGKGGLKTPSEGQLILGMALTAQGKYDEALQAFGQADGNQAAQKAAHVWSLYVQWKKGGAPSQAAH